MNVEQKEKALEIGAGIGTHTESILLTGAMVTAIDISPKSLKILKNKLDKYSNLSVLKCDMEKLPFEDKYFDVIVSAESISYGDNFEVMEEIYRVLKPAGKYICVDSLNDNLIYRFNRWLHYRKGNRSKSTLKRVPDLKLLQAYENRCGEITIYFFGAFTWLVPLLGKTIGEANTARFLDWADITFKTEKSTLKFVMIMKKSK
jgi:ubiquinone/menaquinone biosynthesis C-methylase UbiE